MIQKRSGKMRATAGQRRAAHLTAHEDPEADGGHDADGGHGGRPAVHPASEESQQEEPQQAPAENGHEEALEVHESLGAGEVDGQSRADHDRPEDHREPSPPR